MSLDIICDDCGKALAGSDQVFCEHCYNDLLDKNTDLAIEKDKLRDRIEQLESEQ